MQTHRGILQILLGLLLLAIVTFIPDVLRADWNLPLWVLIPIALIDLVAIGVLAFLIRYIVKSMQSIDVKEKTEQKKSDTRLMNKISKGINQTLESAIQKQTEAIIKAIQSKKE